MLLLLATSTAMKKKVYNLLSVAKDVVSNPDATSVGDKQSLIDEINELLESTDKTPWWVVALKVLAYAIGLILAGYGTTAMTTSLFHMF